MRLVISALSAPSELNGVSRHAANIARGLLSLSDVPEIHFVAAAWQKEMFNRAISLRDPRLHFHWIPIRCSNRARLLWYYRELPMLATRLNADVLHMAYTMPIRAKAVPCPKVVSLHDLYSFDIPENFGMVKSALNRRIVHQCLRSVDAIACVSSSTRERLLHWLPSSFNRKAVTIFNAVEPVDVVPDSGALGLREGHPFLLCIAQHRPNKNIVLALRIFERALWTRVVAANTKLLIVGIPGPDTRKIYAQIERSALGDAVIVTRGISDAELQWCYRHCILLLAPSRIEGFGLPIAEALLAGCPVVCSDISPFREIGAGRCRYVAFGKDVLNEYVRAIDKTITEGRRNPVALPHLLPGAIAGDYMALYRKLLHRFSSCPSAEPQRLSGFFFKKKRPCTNPGDASF